MVLKREERGEKRRGSSLELEAVVQQDRKMGVRMTGEERHKKQWRYNMPVLEHKQHMKTSNVNHLQKRQRGKLACNTGGKRSPQEGERGKDNVP
jgi:hypothetical protein